MSSTNYSTRDRCLIAARMSATTLHMLKALWWHVCTASAGRMSNYVIDTGSKRRVEQVYTVVI
eukprot:COSAG01_NODE_2673_length_7266_cov_24.715920_5_plen_63_part_00